MLTPTPLLAQSADLDLRKVYRDLETIEREIEQILLEESYRGPHLQGKERDFQRSEEELAKLEAADAEASRDLRELSAQSTDDLFRIDAAIADDRDSLDESRSALRLTSVLLLYQAESGDPGDPRTLALAYALSDHNFGVRNATERILELEARRELRREGRSRLASIERHRAVSGNERLDELRRSHTRLVAQLASMTRRAKNAQGRVLDLTDQRRELNLLLARLDMSSSRDRAIKNAESLPSPALPDLTATLTVPSPPDKDIAVIEIPEPPRLGDPVTRTPDPELYIDPARENWVSRRGPVYALAPGRILYAAAFAGYAHVLIIDHGGGWSTVYGNLTRCDVLEGQSVAADAQVGAYEPKEIAPAEPLWLEVRQNTNTVAIENLPGAGQMWSDRLFGVPAR